MSLEGEFAAILLIAAAAGAWYALFHVLPRNLLSLYRYKLWRLRDGLYDELASGSLPRAPLFDFLLKGMEEAIRHADETSFLNLVSRGFFGRLTDEDVAFLRCIKEERQSLSSRHRRRFDHYERRLSTAMLQRLLLQTPSGWLGAMTLPIWLPYLLFRDRHIVDRETRTVQFSRRIEKAAHVPHRGPLPVT